MEIKDSLHIEIFHTLEKIERLNRAIQFHIAMKDGQDELAIEQYRQQKAHLTEQLLALLETMDVRLHIAAA
jgi:hypothetical protein